MKKNKNTYYLLAALMVSACGKVETTSPEKKNIIDAVFASGNVVSNLEYKVTANAEGYLVQRFVEEGDPVTADMPLFQLSNTIQSEQVANAEANYADALNKLKDTAPERVQLELQVEQAKAQLVLDEKNFQRHKRLLTSNAVSKVEFEKAKMQYENALRTVQQQEKSLEDLINTLELNLKNATTQLVVQKETNADYFLSSTIDGEVLQVYKQPGDLVRRGELVAVIGGGDKKAKLFISEEDITEVAVGQQVFINLNTEQDRIYKGVLSKIYPSFDNQEQSFIVEASFREFPKALYHNTQLQANIIINQKADTWVIPTQFLSAGDSVLLRNGDFKYVKVGVRNEQWVEIIEGIDVGVTLQKPSNL